MQNDVQCIMASYIYEIAINHFKTIIINNLFCYSIFCCTFVGDLNPSTLSVNFLLLNFIRHPT